MEWEQVLFRIILVGARGFEPPTPRSRTVCATRLRYAPMKNITISRRQKVIGIVDCDKTGLDMTRGERQDYPVPDFF